MLSVHFVLHFLKFASVDDRTRMIAGKCVKTETLTLEVKHVGKWQGAFGYMQKRVKLETLECLRKARGDNGNYEYCWCWLQILCVAACEHDPSRTFPNCVLIWIFRVLCSRRCCGTPVTQIHTKLCWSAAIPCQPPSMR